MSDCARKSCFAPIANASARVLILGTLPGDQSLRQQQYYAHPQNQFWRILYDCFDETPEDDYAARLRFVEKQGIAIWDVLASAARQGSLDTAIKGGVPNDFVRFFTDHTHIQAIGFNGLKAHALFAHHFGRGNSALLAEISLTVLPSTSPAATRMYRDKVKSWRVFFEGVQSGA